MFALLLLASVASAQQKFWQSASLATCLRDANIRFDTASDAHYNLSRAIWQLDDRFQYAPMAIVAPADVFQVSTAVRCAALHGHKVVARSGGHSPIGSCLGGRDSTVVIDLEPGFAGNVALLPSAPSIVAIPAGKRLGPTYLELYNKYGRTFAGGLCPSIGIGGHLATGGYAHLHRSHGLAMDGIVAYEAVHANGSIVYVTRETHPDLFWGLNDVFPSVHPGVLTRMQAPRRRWRSLRPTSSRPLSRHLAAYGSSWSGKRKRMSPLKA
jgi:FAD/FMN-containing dehydrogenase